MIIGEKRDRRLSFKTFFVLLSCRYQEEKREREEDKRRKREEEREKERLEQERLRDDLIMNVQKLEQRKLAIQKELTRRNSREKKRR